ncbi:MAG: MaoC/PaaZ C-terminal domain-containing protein [Solirubrobacteraceae bacterium]
MTERELSSTPSMLPMFALAGAAMIPGASRLPFLGGGADEIPDLVLKLSDVETDLDRLARYDRVCSFSLGDTLPPTYPHMLCFPLHLALMTDGRFPFGAIGLVHIANRIVQHRPIGARERLSLRVWATPLESHPRGVQFGIRSEARVGEELVWEELSTNLRRGADGGSAEPLTSGSEPPARPSAAAPSPPSSKALPASATWRLPGDLGRRYGAVSGDLNPIHVHPLTARLFGFRSAIAHGMWTKARCLAALGPELPGACTVDVAFKRPILLPATVEYAEGRDSSEIRFGVRDAERDKPHLDGVASF